MIKYLYVLTLICSISISYGQLYIGSDGMTLEGNEALNFDGLTLTPSSDLTLTSTTLSRRDANSISPAPAGTYIKRYFAFSNTTPSFSGSIRFS